MINTYQNKLLNYISVINDVELRKAVHRTLKSVDFFDAETPASLHFHHHYDHGLLVHTVEVVEYALHIASTFKQVNLDVLTAAAICHDVSKVREYEVKVFEYKEDVPKYHLFRGVAGFVEGTTPSNYRERYEYWVLNEQYHRTIHHIQGGFAEFYRHASSVNNQTVEAVGHAILAHHGPVKEWGSSVAPASLEATILHQADYLSAHYGPNKDLRP